MIQPDKTPKGLETPEKIAKFAIFRPTGKTVWRVKRCKKPHAGRYHFVARARIAAAWTRKYFETRGPAETFAQLRNTEITNQGRECAEFPTWLRVMADNCQQRLQTHGKTIEDATAHFLAFLDSTKKSCTFADLLREVLAAKRADGASKSYLVDLKHRLGRFSVDFGEEVVATITGPQIDDWLRGLGLAPVTRNNFRRVLIVAFNHARGRGYGLTNPAESCAEAKEIDAPVGILSLKAIGRLLCAATEDTLPHFAIGCFAGLRPAEISRLEWRHVDFESGLIEVTALNSKTAKRRFVKILPCLAKWLTPFAGSKGNVSPINERKKLYAVRKTAGLVGERWPHDALRHSYASYHLAHFKDAAALALEMGHTDTGMIFSNYREVVRPSEAERYWEIEPTGAAEQKIVPFAPTASAEDKDYEDSALPVFP